MKQQKQVDEEDDEEKFNTKINYFYMASFLVIIGILIYSLYFAKKYSPVEEYSDMEFWLYK